jgi:hypothetical protein
MPGQACSIFTDGEQNWILRAGIKWAHAPIYSNYVLYTCEPSQPSLLLNSNASQPTFFAVTLLHKHNNIALLHGV